MLAELTHRCPLQCVYCSNPVRLLKSDREMNTAAWLDVLAQAADLGILQIHLSGGEPTLRQDLEAMVELLAKRGVYMNLVTGVTLDRDRCSGCAIWGWIAQSAPEHTRDLSDKIGNWAA
jgi:pyrroloquinoline quinone biosynthesis protein E